MFRSNLSGTCSSASPDAILFQNITARQRCDKAVERVWNESRSNRGLDGRPSSFSPTFGTFLKLSYNIMRLGVAVTVIVGAKSLTSPASQVTRQVKGQPS